MILVDGTAEAVLFAFSGSVIKLKFGCLPGSGMTTVVADCDGL